MDQIKNCELKFVVISEISKNPLTKKFFSDIINMFGYPKQYTRITVQRDAVFLLTLFLRKKEFLLCREINFREWFLPFSPFL